MRYPLLLVMIIVSVGNQPVLRAQESADTLPTYLELLPTVPSWQTAKKRLYGIHAENSRTLYCGCEYKDKVVDLKSCGLGTEDGTRWLRTEVEHVVPASVIGKTHSCWEEGGRDHCIKVDPTYKIAHNDMHNMYPAVGGINGARSNKDIGLLAGDDLAYGSCDFELDEVNDRVEPRPEVRGDIARTYFYMSWMYGVPLTEGQRRLFLHWHQSDPVDDWERRRNELIGERQGNLNPFIR